MAVVSCDSDPIVVDPDAFENIYVHCILSPSSAHQEVYLSKTKLRSLPVPVENARLRIIGPAGEVNLPHVGEGTYRDATAALLVVPGSRYDLHIVLQDGRQISASTTVPSFIEGWHAQESDTVIAKWTPYEEWDGGFVEYPLPAIHWRAAGGLATMVSQFVDGILDYQRHDSEILTTLDSLSSRTTRFYFYSGMDRNITGHSFYFSRFDTAAAIYLYRIQGWYNSDEFPPELFGDYQENSVSINISGAFGFFGSAIRDSMKLIVRMEN